jgi:ATP-binding cassette subfamily F protein 1
MSNRRNKTPEAATTTPPEEEQAVGGITNTRAEARKKRKLRKQGLLVEEDEPAPPDQEAVAERIEGEKMASAVSGISQKAIDAADTNTKDVLVLGFDMKYKEQNLLENADLRIIHGRKYGIIGPNGAGVLSNIL